MMSLRTKCKCEELLTHVRPYGCCATGKFIFGGMALARVPRDPAEPVDLELETAFLFPVDKPKWSV